MVLLENHRSCCLDGGVFESDAKGNKLLMTLGETGVSVAERTIQSVVSAGMVILVVTGHDADKLQMCCQILRCTVDTEIGYKDGMGTSIAKAFKDKTLGMPL